MSPDTISEEEMKYNSTDINITDSYYPFENQECIILLNGTYYYDPDPCCIISEHGIYRDPCCGINDTIQGARPEQFDFGYRILFSVVTPIVAIFGIVGILLTIIVLARKSMSTSINCYLIALSSADLGFLVIIFPRFFERQITIEQSTIFGIYMHYAVIFLNTFLFASVWINVLLAVERYIAIVHPLRANTICTEKRARVVIAVVFIFAFICRLPSFFEYRVQTTYDQTCGETTSFTHLVPWLLGANHTYQKIQRWLVDCVLCAILPFCFLLVFNVRLIYEIGKATKYRSGNAPLDQTMQRVMYGEQFKISLIIACMIIIFFVCEAPYVVTNAYINIHGKYSKDMYNVLYVTISLLAMKSTLNFIVYCWFSERFWEALKYKLCLSFCFHKTRTTCSASGSIYTNGKRRNDMPEQMV